MVRNHVAKGAGPIVVVAPALDPEGLGDGDLDAVHVAAVPDRLEDPVGEAECQDVLNGLLAQVVVDAEDLGFPKDLEEPQVQVPGGVEVPAEGLLHDEATALSALLPVQAGGAELAGDVQEVAGGAREIEEDASRGAPRGADLGQRLPETGEAVGIVEVAAHPANTRAQRRPEPRVDRLAGVGLQGGVESLAVALVVQVGATVADEGEAPGEAILAGQVQDRRQQEAASEISRPAKHHEGAAGVVVLHRLLPCRHPRSPPCGLGRRRRHDDHRNSVKGGGCGAVTPLTRPRGPRVSAGWWSGHEGPIHFRAASK